MRARQALERWLKGFAACVRRRDFTAGQDFFDRRVVGFGSYARQCVGLETLVRRQWMKIWPNITAFDFTYRQAHYAVSADGRMICGMVPWRSVGYRDGRAFRRTGRMTVLLRRAPRGRWLALHTHYSLTPGTPQTTVR